MFIRSGDSSATIDAAGAYLRRLRIAGIPILKETSDMQPTHGGMALLAPYANRIRDGTYSFMGKEYHFQTNKEGNSIHGFAKDSMFQVVRRTRARLLLHSLLSDDGYPGALDLLVTFIISPDKLEVKIRAENDSNTVLPFQLGFHPYFLYKENWKAKASGTILKLSSKDNFFPNGTGEFIKADSLKSSNYGSIDNCFWVDGSFSMDLGTHILRLMRSGLPFVQFYNGKHAQNRSIAVEPMTAPPDCFNNRIGILEIQPGEFKTFSLQMIVDGKNGPSQEEEDSNQS